MKKILGIGNALVDILFKLHSEEMVQYLGYPKGSMQLISTEELSKITDMTKDMNHHIAAGGSASNTMVGLAMLGANASLIGKIGDDPVGIAFKNSLIKNNINPTLLHSDLPSGRCHVFISPDSERTMCTYLGAASDLKAEDITTELFSGYEIIHVEGYLVQNYDLMEKIGAVAKECNLKISIDLASFNVVEENLEFLNKFIYKYVSILFANEEEAKAFTSLNAEEALESMSEKIETVIVKVGSKGSYAKRKDQERVFIHANKVNCIDTTGAGDLYASGFLYGLLNNMPLTKCGEIATLCAGEVIQIFGAKITDAQWIKIKAQI